MLQYFELIKTKREMVKGYSVMPDYGNARLLKYYLRERNIFGFDNKFLTN